MAKSTLCSKSTRNLRLIACDFMTQGDLDSSKPNTESDRVRQRLTRISHHFLSEAATEHEAQRQTTHRVFFLDTQAQLPLFALAEQIALRGWTVQIVYPPGTEPATITVQPATTIALRNPVTLIFQTINVSSLMMLNVNSTLLLTMPARYDSLRETYLMLKQHQHQLHKCVIGATIVGPHDQGTAHDWYRALSLAGKRHLGLDIVSYTFCRNSSAPEPTTELHALASLIYNDVNSLIQQQLDQYDTQTT